MNDELLKRNALLQAQGCVAGDMLPLTDTEKKLQVINYLALLLNGNCGLGIGLAYGPSRPNELLDEETKRVRNYARERLKEYI